MNELQLEIAQCQVELAEVQRHERYLIEIRRVLAAKSRRRWTHLACSTIAASMPISIIFGGAYVFRLIFPG